MTPAPSWTDRMRALELRHHAMVIGGSAVASQTNRTRTVTASGAVLIGDDTIFVDLSAQDVTLTLPQAARSLRKVFTFKIVGTGYGHFLYVVPSTGDFIDYFFTQRRLWLLNETWQCAARKEGAWETIHSSDAITLDGHLPASLPGGPSTVPVTDANGLLNGWFDRFLGLGSILAYPTPYVFRGNATLVKSHPTAADQIITLDGADWTPYAGLYFAIHHYSGVGYKTYFNLPAGWTFSTGGASDILEKDNAVVWYFCDSPTSIIRMGSMLVGDDVGAHAITHKHGGTDEIGSIYPYPNVIPKADFRGYLNNWIDALNALSMNEIADGTTQYLSRFDFCLKSLASGSPTTLKIKDGFFYDTASWTGQIYNEGGGYTTITLEDSHTFEDGTTSKVLAPYEAALLYGRSPGVWNIWPVFNTRGSITASLIKTPSMGAKKTTFETFDANAGFEASLHDGASFGFFSKGSWGGGGFQSVEFEGLPGQGSVGQYMMMCFLDGYFSLHPINARPPEAGYTRIWISDGIAGYPQAKIAVQSGHTGVDLTTKIIADVDLDITPVNGNIPNFIGAGAEMEDSGVSIASLKPIGGSIVGANITADVNDLFVPGLDGTQLVLLDPDADGWKIGGIQTGAAGRKLTIFNPSGSYYMLLEHDGAGSTPGNRIYTYTGMNYRIEKGCSVTLAYDDSAGAWRIISETGDADRWTKGSGNPSHTPRLSPSFHEDTDTGNSFVYTTLQGWKMILTGDLS